DAPGVTTPGTAGQTRTAGAVPAPSAGIRCHITAGMQTKRALAYDTPQTQVDSRCLQSVPGGPQGPSGRAAAGPGAAAGGTPAPRAPPAARPGTVPPKEPHPCDHATVLTGPAPL